MSKPYEVTTLWVNAFSPTGNEVRDRLSSELAVEYGKMWDCGCALATRIASDAQGITLHDERHFKRLWECASLVAGANYRLSPIEGFVLGASILIHDAAHTVIAYEGGLDEIIKSKEWLDALAFQLMKEDGQPASDKDLEGASFEQKKAALFETLRVLHAKQAKTMIGRTFRHPAFGTPLYLLENPMLRTHFGELIGEIAASHNWDLSSLVRLGRQKNPISPYHVFGPIRPLVIAALLRTADAIQIDHARATDFEMALSRPDGASYDHWAAQNRLAVDTDSQDHSALLITSTSAFGENDVRAWWIAYELAKVADHELRSCDDFLRDCDEEPFTVTRVRDVSEPARFSEHVKTLGWVPANVEVRVTNAKKIVEMFGGAGLYGDDPLVPLRELIQNSVDAIRPRRVLEQNFPGKIEISIKEGCNSSGENGFWLEVADDGIGMSAAMLTGPFLSFGDSGWSSEILRRERPGLLGRRLRQVGRFGIGFFSVFMLSDEVKVATRMFDSGLDAIRTLFFRKSMGLRPILRSGGDNGETMLTTTRVSIFLTEANVKSLLSRESRGTRTLNDKRVEEQYSLRELIAHVCPAIDVAIYTRQQTGPVELATGKDWIFEDTLSWLKRINDVTDDRIPPLVLQNLDMVEAIESGGEYVGRAALNPTQMSLGTRTIGGFSRKRGDFIDTYSNDFVGLLGMSPRGPRRDYGPWLDPESLRSWSERQLKRWSLVQLDPNEKHLLSIHAANFGGNPEVMANVPINEEWMSVQQFLDRMKEGQAFLAPLERKRHNEDGYFQIGSSATQGFGFGFYVDRSDWHLETNVLSAGQGQSHSPYWEIPTEKNPATSSFMACVIKLAKSQNFDINIEAGNYKVATYLGRDIPALRVKSGEDVLAICIRISALRSDIQS